MLENSNNYPLFALCRTGKKNVVTPSKKGQVCFPQSSRKAFGLERYFSLPFKFLQIAGCFSYKLTQCVS